MAEVTTNLSIGQVAERTGLSVHALRFYEHEGLFVNPVRRGPGGRRVYSQDDVDWLTVCIILRASGMPLPALRRYADLVRQGAGNEEERLALMREHQTSVTTQIGKLTECLDLIRFKVGVYEDLLDPDNAGDHQCHGPTPATPAPSTEVRVG
ncbi:DNA-binding transcriptional regulator, MerR family [Micromonospora citrea]|uniref:DNA-binding transcriptional regulator, MerR family n=1 Tax=Micromonospora citrea TaxID=47855 RepID=A0A1C6TS02_9ACTN|nr:MerR family transcriptional regulator [Micromonospora citrea]SCL44527.1 DNA-binding transcriptional regulator, MerR family [Micromonospora citrea]